MAGIQADIQLDFYSSYALYASIKQIVPKTGFFKDRYFPSGAGDVFATNKVLVEYQRGDQMIAPFVAQRAGDVAVGREGYTVAEYEPPRIAVSRTITVDDLKRRDFGEALYSTDTPEMRAARLQVRDMEFLDARIARREEWMCAQTMINNGCTVQEYLDAETKGEARDILFYDPEKGSDHLYVIASGSEWNSGGSHFTDVKNMCRMLSKNGLPAIDLVLGTDAYDTILADPETRERIDKNSGLITGQLQEQLTQYDGVTFAGRLNYGGHMLNIFCADEIYVDDDGKEASFFPSKSAMVAAPGCGHLMYGNETQMDFGSSELTTHSGARIPKLVVDQKNDVRKIRLVSKPLAAPKNYCPYIYAPNVVA